MARATGIEIGEAAVTVVELDGTPRKWKVNGAARTLIEGTAESGEERVKAVAAAVKASMKGAKAGREQVALGISASLAVVREIPLPFTAPEQIQKVIKFESESHLHSCDIDDVVVAWHKVSENAGKARVLVFAVRKDDLKAGLGALDRIGIDPVHVNLDATALYQFWKALPGTPSEGGHVLIDISDSVTHIVLISEGNLRMIRSVRLGTESVTRSVAVDLNIEKDKARSLTRRMVLGDLTGPFENGDSGDLSSTTPKDELREGILRDSATLFAGRLANEVKRTLSSVLFDGKVASVQITGPGSTVPGLPEALAEAVGAPVTKFDTVAGAEHKLSKELAATIGGASGLALIGLGHNPLKLEFRQEEFVFTRGFDRVKEPALALLVLLLVLGGVMTASAWNTAQEARQRLAIGAAQGREIAEIYARSLEKPAIAKILGKNDGKAESERIRTNLKSKENDGSAVLAAIRTEISGVTGPENHIRNAYGIEPGSKSSDVRGNAVSSLTRIRDWYDVLLRHPELHGKFSIESLKASTMEIEWTMELEDSSAFEVLAKDFRELPGKPKVESGTDRPMGTKRRFEGCKITWPKVEI